ncbi:RNA-directed DNA polymerase, eukaryota [Tanacetum coccineum]
MTGSLGGLGGSLWPAMNDLFHLIVYMKMKGKVMTNAVERNHGGKNVKISMEDFASMIDDNVTSPKENSAHLNEVVDSAQQSIPKENSYDPFNIYDILNKENKDVNAAATNSSIPFPPGFTPDKPDTDVDELVAQKDQFQPDVKSVGSSSHTVESANNVDDQFSTGSIENIQKKKESGSILEILEEMISVGQTMGFSMEDLALYNLNDSNAMVRFKKKLQALKKVIRLWIRNYKRNQMNRTTEIKIKLKDIDKILDQLGANDDLLSVRSELLKQYHDIHSVETRESIQKAKIKWAVEGDENSKFFHGMINRKRANLAVKGVMIDGEWVDDPSESGIGGVEAPISRDEIRRADLGLGEINLWAGCSFPVGCKSSLFASSEKHEIQKSVAYDSIRWDYLGDVLKSFGFGVKWCSWIRGILNSSMAFILINGSPTKEFQFHRGLKQGDPLAPYLFIILIMEVFTLILLRVISRQFYRSEATPGVGYRNLRFLEAVHYWLCGSSYGLTTWRSDGSSRSPSKVNVLAWKISMDRLPTRVNLHRRGVQVSPISCPICCEALENLDHLLFCCDLAKDIARSICNWWGLALDPVLRIDLGYLGLIWFSFNQVQNKCWKECFTLPGGVSGHIETISSSLIQIFEKMVVITLASGDRGQGFDHHSLHGRRSFSTFGRIRSSLSTLGKYVRSGCTTALNVVPWETDGESVLREAVHVSLKKNVLILMLLNWIDDNLLKLFFPRLFALEENKDISVVDKMNTSISSFFRRHVRGGVESQQLDQLSLLLDTVILSNMDDKWFWDLNGDGVFQVKDVRSMLDEAFLPKMEVPTRWIKSIPIKVNVFAWKLYLDRLPTRSNLSRRNVSLPSLACPLCDHVLEDSSHLFFGCSVAKDIQKLICRWWNLDVHPYESYEDWLSWFKSIRLGSKTKEVLEGVFYVSWWSLWNFRNQFLFASPIPRKDAIFDNIVLRSFYWVRGIKTTGLQVVADCHYFLFNNALIVVLCDLLCLILWVRPIHPVIFTSPYLKTEEFKVTPIEEIYKRLTNGVDVGTKFIVYGMVTGIDLNYEWKYIQCTIVLSNEYMLFM